MTLRMEIIDGKPRYYVDDKEVPEHVYRPLYDAWWDRTAKLFG
jgi:hypothetical protein